jgi:hypothetical protein
MEGGVRPANLLIAQYVTPKVSRTFSCWTMAHSGSALIRSEVAVKKRLVRQLFYLRTVLLRCEFKISSTSLDQLIVMLSLDEWAQA